MKKLITLVVVVLLISASTSYGFFGDKDHNNNNNTNKNTNINGNLNANLNKNENINDNSNTNSNIQGQLQGQQQKQVQQQGQLQGQGQFQDASNTQGQSQVNEGNNTVVDIDNSQVIPAPIAQSPDFAAPVDRTELDQSWTGRFFDLNKTEFTVNELTNLANPSRCLSFLWPEWGKDFQVEMACWDTAKSQKRIKVISNPILTGTEYTKMGEAHARAKTLRKSEMQVAAALSVEAAKRGAKIVVIRTFSNPVTKADTAVFGGAGASITGTGDIVNSAGGFGWTTAEKIYRSYVVAELYK